MDTHAEKGAWSAVHGEDEFRQDYSDDAGEEDDDDVEGSVHTSYSQAYRNGLDRRSSAWLAGSLGRQQRLLLPALSTLIIALAIGVIALLLRPPVHVTVLPAEPKDVTFCETSVRFECGDCIPAGDARSGLGGWRFNAERDEKNYALTHEQCEAAFPGLFVDIDKALNRHKSLGSKGRITQQTFDKQRLRNETMRAMVYDGELFLIDYHNQAIDYPLNHRLRATLHDLNRALAAAPEPLPNVEFALHDGDFMDPAEYPGGPYWTYTRKTSYNNSWLMPDFGFYSWPQPRVGSFQEVRRKMKAVDSEYAGLAGKIPKMFWRGSVHMAEELRNGLVDVAKGKNWSDIGPMEWADREDINGNYIPIEEHCRYAMLVHTEGRSYSGRLKYLQNCESLIFAHKLQWIQPFEYLLVREGPNQNYVEVERDFSDLEEKVEYYMTHLDEAQRIVNNGVNTFRDRYSTPAANTCYWRRLIKSWAEVNDRPAFFKEDGTWRGAAFESVSLMNMMFWEPF